MPQLMPKKVVTITKAKTLQNCGLCVHASEELMTDVGTKCETVPLCVNPSLKMFSFLTQAKSGNFLYSFSGLNPRATKKIW